MVTVCSFNIRSFGSNCSARNCSKSWPSVIRFQYPLFRIELLSIRPRYALLENVPVSISALSDRIAQPVTLRGDHNNFLFQYPLFRIELLSLLSVLGGRQLISVSISALSDRIAQLLRSTNTSLRSSFQYPLFRIELLSTARTWIDCQGHGCFNIRSFGSNCSARLFPPPAALAIMFQYPLFRIELLSRYRPQLRFRPHQVSISALSDRIAQRSSSGYSLCWRVRFNIRSFGSNCSATNQQIVMPLALVSISALSDRIDQHCCVAALLCSGACFNIRSFGSNCSA